MRSLARSPTIEGESRPWSSRRSVNIAPQAGTDLSLISRRAETRGRVGVGTNLQINKSFENERLNRWPGGGGYERDAARLVKCRDPGWFLDMITSTVSGVQASETAE
jgi:hypothetical protein